MTDVVVVFIMGLAFFVPLGIFTRGMNDFPGNSEVSGKIMEEEIAAVEAQIERLNAQWPAHSVPPGLMAQLDELEERLDELRAAADETA